MIIFIQKHARSNVILVNGTPLGCIFIKTSRLFYVFRGRCTVFTVTGNWNRVIYIGLTWSLLCAPQCHHYNRTLPIHRIQNNSCPHLQIHLTWWTLLHWKESHSKEGCPEWKDRKQGGVEKIKNKAPEKFETELSKEFFWCPHRNLEFWTFPTCIHNR